MSLSIAINTSDQNALSQLSPISVPLEAPYPKDTAVPSYRTLRQLQFQLNRPPTQTKDDLPSRPLRMISLRIPIPRIRMYQRGKRTPINHQPGHKRSKLCGREDIDFEHAYGMGA